MHAPFQVFTGTLTRDRH